jgi:hypothetical protein
MPIVHKLGPSTVGDSPKYRSFLYFREDIYRFLILLTKSGLYNTRPSEMSHPVKSKCETLVINLRDVKRVSIIFSKKDRNIILGLGVTVLFVIGRVNELFLNFKRSK